MARKKPQHVFPVKNDSEANTSLAEIAEIKRSLDKINNCLNDDIDKLKAEAKALAAPHESRLAALENGLMAYAEYNRDELFSGKKSKEYNFGSIGYRKSTEIKPLTKTTIAQVLGKVKELGFSAAIRVKESLNKDEMHTWPDERLSLVGARRVAKDTFWYEINEEEIRN